MCVRESETHKTLTHTHTHTHTYTHVYAEGERKTDQKRRTEGKGG